MATYTKFQQFVEDLAHGVHNFDSNTIKVALSNASNAPSASADAVLGDITTVSTANLDGVTLTKGSSGQTTGTYKYVPNDLTMTASGAVGPFRYVIIYNDTAANDELIACSTTALKSRLQVATRSNSTSAQNCLAWRNRGGYETALALGWGGIRVVSEVI